VLRGGDASRQITHTGVDAVRDRIARHGGSAGVQTSRVRIHAGEQDGVDAERVEQVRVTRGIVVCEVELRNVAVDALVHADHQRKPRNGCFLGARRRHQRQQSRDAPHE
jgi:hypothetical protein